MFFGYVDWLNISPQYVDEIGIYRHMTSWHPDRPYNDLPRLPPKADVETRSVLKACVEARAALAALKQAAELIPNQAILISTIPTLEAQASSEIENVITTTDRLFRFAQAGRENQADPATREALRYRRALHKGFAGLANRPLSIATALDICSTIKGVQMEIRRVPGTALQKDASGEIVYTPPAGEATLRELLTNWEVFIHNDRDGLDPLVRMAIMHYQFEAIHPLTDGNGRTGRVLNVLYLIEKKLLDLPILYLSRYIILSKGDYYNLLQSVTETGSWESWILYILNGITSTSAWMIAKIRAIRALMQTATRHVREHAPQIYSHELIEQIFQQPYCRIQDLVDAGLAQRQTASAYLKRLSDAGILVEARSGREKLFIHPALIDLLTSDDNTVAPYIVAEPKEIDLRNPGSNG
ncbi:protein adenylyltransferase Fic [Parvibaculum sp.]|uniref:protein adenylyltransferase Fic n=1 Tax=Parvibaculum sp. TaxID=2024848 RepID=UPI0034A07684